MTTVANQKTITTKGAKHDKDNIYGMINVEAAGEAMEILKPNAFKVWFYLAKN